MAIVLDSWALLALLRGEEAGDLVRTAWAEEGAAMCSVNLGEVLYLELRARGTAQAGEVIEEARAELDLVEPDWALVRRAAKLKALGGLSYADCFCIATAQQLEAPLWTGDPEIVDRGAQLQVEVVDLQP